MACKVIVNGSQSNLFNTILEAYNGDEELATALHSHFNSQEFIKYFGNWQEDYNSDIKESDYSYNKDTSRIEDNGEPKLFKDNKGDYYYIDKYKNKEYLIFNSKSLNSLFKFSEIKLLTKVLANSFIKNNLNIDFENIDLSNTTGSIKQSVIDKVNERINTFNATDDYLWEDKAELLQEALNNNLDELVTNVKNYLQQSKISTNEFKNDNLEDTELENIEISENEKDPGFGNSSFERSSKDNISANVKLRLSLIEDTSEKDRFLNDVVYVDFDEIYVTLLNNLNSKIALDIDGQEDLFNIYKEEVSKLINKKPYFKELYRLLSNPDLSNNIKAEFVQAFNLDKNVFNTSITKNVIKVNTLPAETLPDGSIITRKETVNNVNHDVLNVANVGSRETEVFNQWNNNFKVRYTELVDGNIIINPSNRDIIKGFKNDLTKIKLNKDIPALVTLLRKLGIETTSKGFEHYLDNLELINQDNELSNKILNNTITDLGYFIDNVINNKNTNYDNILNDQSIFRDIARAEAFYISEGSDSSVFTAGKQKWVYSYPSYLSSKIKSWQKNRNLLLNHYEISKYNQGSDWMKYLLALGDTYQINEYIDLTLAEQERIEESKRRINELELASFNVVQEDENANEGLDNKSVDKATYISDTVNKVLGFIKNSKSYYRTTTPADKGTQYELYIARNHLTNARRDENNNIIINQSASEVIFEYFNSEYKRMKFEREFMNDPTNEDKLSVYYHLGQGHAFKSQIFPSLSFDQIDNSLKDLTIEEKTLITSIYNRDNNGNLTNETSYSDLNNPKIKNALLKYINNQLSNNIKGTLDNLVNQGVFELINGEYINKTLDSKIWNNYQTDNALKAASDFYINSIISHVEYSKMFSGDIAYYKNGVDYKKRVPATYTDGLQLRLNDINKDYNIAVTESIEIATPFLDELTELVGKDVADSYKKINSADAQAWITPQRWKNIFQSLGKWNNIYESSYQKLLGNNTEPFTVEELKKVAPPVKGVYFQLVNGKPVFLKYSQAVLSPRLRKGNGLEKIYNQMINQSIDELVTFDAIKVGSVQPSKVHDDNGNVLDNVKFNVMNIPSNGWKLQQDLPVKTFKETEVGSQIQKNIFQGLAFHRNELFNLDNNEITGDQVLEQIANTVGELSNRGLSKLNKEFGVDNNNIITNVERFYSTIADELRERGGSTNVINALESETSIYGIPQAQSKLQNIFASIVNKRVLKIKTNGGSFIQMSNFGLTKDNAESQGVIWSPRALSTTHEPQFLKDDNGEFILSENGKRIVRPGGILLSGSFIAKYIPDYRKYTPQQLFDEIIDRKIQENIIGYRIPNQGLSSNDALEIVGILPEENGDTVVAYTGITTKTGSDFDIDKMYMMFPTYHLEDGKLVYDSYNNEVSDSEQSIGALQNRLIELYKAVLTNEQVIKEVMTPIDFDHIKNDIRSIFKQKPISNLSLFDPLADIDVKYSFLAGKAGVGQEANALIDYVLGTLGDLGITNFNIDKGNINLDEEYSESLDDKDLKYYQKQLNISDDEVQDLKKIKISHSLSAILNAFVDIAKDPYITEGNWVSMTTNTGNLLLRKGVHPFYVNAFLAQPIISKYITFTEQYEQSSLQSLDTRDQFRKEYVKEQLTSSLSLRDKYIDLNVLYDKLFTTKDIKQDRAKDVKKGNNNFTQSNILNTLGLGGITLSPAEVNQIRQVTELLTNTHSQIFFPSLYNIIENNSLETIRKNIVNPNVEFQAKVFNDFLRYQNASKAIKTNIDASKFMVNGMGKDVTQLQIAKNLVDSIMFKEDQSAYDEDFKGNIITGFKSKFSNPNGTESMFSKYYNNVILKTLDIVQANPKLFLSANPVVQSTFNEISHSINGDILIDPNLGTTLEKHFYSYTMSGFQPFQISIEERRTLLNQFPKQFKTFKESNKGLYSIIDELSVRPGEGKLEYVGLSNRKKSIEFEENLTNSWSDLLIDEPEFANDLIKYSYFTSGFAMNISQFYTYIPYQWFQQNKINRFIIDQSNEYTNQNSNVDNFIDQIFMSEIFNKRLVKITLPYKIDTKSSFNNLNKGFKLNDKGKAGYFTVRQLEDPSSGLTTDVYYKLLGYDNQLKAIYSRFTPNINGELVDIKPLNIRDRKGNKIVNYNTEGLILKASNDITNLIDTNYYNELNNTVVYPRDHFYRQDYNNDVTEEFSLFEQNKELFESNGITEELYNSMLNEFGQEYIEDYIKKCK